MDAVWFSCSVEILCRVEQHSDKWLISAPSSMRIVAGMPAIRPFAIRRLGSAGSKGSIGSRGTGEVDSVACLIFSGSRGFL